MVDLFRLLDTDGEGELPGFSSWWFLHILPRKDRFFARLVGKFYATRGNDREVVVLFSKTWCCLVVSWLPLTFRIRKFL